MIDWKFRTSGCGPIGLDIGHDSVKMLQLAINHEQVRVVAADKVRIGADVNGDEEARSEFVISAIKQMRAKGNFRGRSVVSCLPNESVRITSLRLTEGEQDRIEQVLSREVVGRFGMDPERDTVKYVLAGDVRQGDEMRTELILFAADSEAIRKHIELVEQVGLQPVAIDIVPCALFRSFERSLRRLEDKERTVVFMDVGSRFTTVVFGRGGEISFAKQIPMGGEKFNQDVAVKLGLGNDEVKMLRGTIRVERTERTERVGEEAESGEDAQGRDEGSGIDGATRQGMVDAIGAAAEVLAREISLCFRYYTVTFRGKRVEKAVLGGGEAYEEILTNVLKRQLAVEIEQAQPLRGFDISDTNLDRCRRGMFSEWAVAVGLGLKGCRDGGEKAQMC